MKLTKVLLSFFILNLVGACATKSDKRQLEKDIFEIQTRLLQMEKQQVSTSQKATNSEQSRTATTNAKLDVLDRDLRMMKGEIDALRMGVITGQLPGLTEEEREKSIASTLTSMETRLVALEESTEELLSVIKKLNSKPKKKKSTSISSLKNLQNAFDKKRYTDVKNDATKVAKKLKGQDREQALFLGAESLYKLGNLREAALKFNDFIESKPTKKYLPKAKMRMGDCFKLLGDTTTAKLYYEELITEFPDSSEASTAKELLSKLGSSTTKG